MNIGIIVFPGTWSDRDCEFALSSFKNVKTFFIWHKESIPKNIDIEFINIEKALSMLSLPREIGLHPVTGKMITANNGRFGPYVKHENTFANIKGENDDFE